MGRAFTAVNRELNRRGNGSKQCPCCFRTFAATSEGCKAFYWHMRREHGAEHEEAFSAVSDAGFEPHR